MFCCSGCKQAESKKAINDRDSIALIGLPDRVKITASEASRIKQGCQAWYDSVLSAKGFNGGMIVAKDGNIVFEKYSGTGHIPRARG